MVTADMVQAQVQALHLQQEQELGVVEKLRVHGPGGQITEFISQKLGL